MAKTNMWPNFFIVGAAKAGTTSLYQYLRQHPQVYMPLIKEPHFFSQVKPRPRSNYFMKAVTEEDGYLALFKGAERFDAVGEASPSYLWDEHVPYRIKQQVHEAKILILLRDPVERAFSHYLADVRAGRVRGSFFEALAHDAACMEKGWEVSHLYVELGQYASQVERYLEVFTKERVRIYLFDDLKREPEAVLRDVATFLGIDLDGVDSITTATAHNPYAAPRNVLARHLISNLWVRRTAQAVVPQRLRKHMREDVLLSRGEKPALDPRAVEYLGSIYEDEIKKLELLLERNLPSLRKNWAFS